MKYLLIDDVLKKLEKKGVSLYRGPLKEWLRSYPGVLNYQDMGKGKSDVVKCTPHVFEYIKEKINEVCTIDESEYKGTTGKKMMSFERWIEFHGYERISLDKFNVLQSETMRDIGAGDYFEDELGHVLMSEYYWETVYPKYAKA